MNAISSLDSDSLLIEGGETLRGTVEISGAKNASLPVLIASLLTNQECIVRKVPELLDTKTTRELLESFGARLRIEGKTWHIDPSGVNSHEAPEALVRKMRASVLVMGPLLARFKKARVAMPGGCSIGVRGIDQHLKVFQLAGASINISHGFILLEAKALKPVEYTFEVITVTGTENALMLLSSCKGTSVLKNVAIEPEVLDLAKALNSMGAEITFEGRTAVIKGTEHLGGFDHSLIPDRIEAGTFAVASHITGGDILLLNANAEHMSAVLEKLSECGADISVSDNAIRVSSKGIIKPLDISTQEYPGFPTDMQAQFTTLCAIAPGQSLITENIFENRFQHISELLRMGADIKVRSRTAYINGKRALTGAEVYSTDLRASAGLVLAGLIAKGTTIVRDIHHLDRGYESLELKLSSLGARIARLPSLSQSEVSSP
ncbi:MAG: UDP-N-acetylglucosamine 1-carboxyvinyltransferase [Aquificaceae bacterium]|nr:UDP-N-acetylglucosamine 1-carboxyvinyltransferase [Aquificaceae bacterium]